MNFQFNNKIDELFVIREGFTFPSMSKTVEYHSTTHSSIRRKKHSKLTPYTLEIPLIVLNRRNTIPKDEVVARLNELLYSQGPKILNIEDTDWYLVGEFEGPYLLPPYFDSFSTVDVQFSSEYPYKFYNSERIQEGSTITIDTKSQLPTLPLVELTGLTGDDVQISNSKADGSFKRIRLSGSLPAGITIDPENETLYRTDTGDERLDLLRIDSNFEDFTLEDGDVVTVNQGSAKITYKELML